MGTRLALLLALGHNSLHLHPAVIAFAVIATTVLYAALAVASPARTCPRCHGERVRVTRHWLTRKTRTRPCRKCSGTGRAPRFGARTLHALIWSVRHERNKP